MRGITIVLLALLVTAAGCSATSKPPAPSGNVVIDLLGVKQEFPVDGRGRLQSAVSLSTADGAVSLSAGANTVFAGTSGPLKTIEVVAATPPAPPRDIQMVGGAYRLLPEGASFQPFVTLTLSHPPLPPGVTQGGLYIAYHDGKEWRMPQYRRVDFTGAKVSTQVDRSAVFAVMSGKDPVPPAASAPVVGAMKGNQAPDFSLRSLDGPEVSLTGLRGRPVIINFWTTWCPYCITEMPVLEQVYQKWSPRGVVLLAVDVQESAELVRSAIQGKGFTFPVLLDEAGDTARKYRVAGFPTTFFIDGDGIIRDIRVGAFPSQSTVETSLKKIMP